MASQRQITAFAHTRALLVWAAILFVALTAWAWQAGAVAAMRADLGAVVPSPALWLGNDPLLSLGVNMGLMVALAACWVRLCNGFNVMRSLTALPGSLFMLLLASFPPLAGQFYGGTLLALTLALCVALLFSTFGREMPMRRVYLVFFLLGLGAFTRAAFLFYAPFLYLGCLQMRLAPLKSFLAALMGLVTPLWIVLGLGIVAPGDIAWGQFAGLWGEPGTLGADLPLVASALFAALAGLGFMAVNAVKVISYNSQARAYNGMLNLLLVATVALAVVDFSHYTVYMPLLALLAAAQAAHFFATHRQQRSFIGVAAFAACCLGLYLLNLLA